MTKPVIAITMGDANGVGPELTLKVLAQPATWDLCQPLLIGDPAVYAQALSVVEIDLDLRPVGAAQEPFQGPGAVSVLCPDGAAVAPAAYGVLDEAKGRAAALCLREAYRLAGEGLVQGVASAPLNKEAFHQAGYDYADELAFLAKETDSPEALMMGVAGGIWTLAVAEHVGFARILDHVKTDRILRYIGYMHATLQRAGSRARIGVAALNVHAGEGGLYGREEIDQIAPAIAAARQKGIDAHGPVPADMVFVQALAGAYDGVVFMHHDQANIARKLQPMDTGATIFYGLPVYAATTAHGTAFDIAGRGIADPGSMSAAVRYAARLATT